MRCFRRKLKPSFTTIPPQKQIWRGEFMRVVEYQNCLSWLQQRSVQLHRTWVFKYQDIFRTYSYRYLRLLVDRKPCVCLLCVTHQLVKAGIWLDVLWVQCESWTLPRCDSYTPDNTSRGHWWRARLLQVDSVSWGQFPSGQLPCG